MDNSAPDIHVTLVRRPLFWSHLAAILLYPYRIVRYKIVMRRINRMFLRQKDLALSPLRLSAVGMQKVLEIELETRITGENR